MGKFLEREKERIRFYRLNSADFSSSAQTDGLYRGKPRPFCIPRHRSEENLFPEIRTTAIDYFAQYDIKWHDAINKKPSNHLCDSMVCGVNFLFPFADKPDALKELLRPLFPQIERMIPLEDAGLFVSFEWIGATNYLGERVARSAKRSRGANCTSADAAIMFETIDGARQIVLIEWKYTESYSRTSYETSRSGTDRTAIYAPLFAKDDFPLNKQLLPSFESLFYEPFYQLMRQQLLANEMEKARELGATRVSLLHICPHANQNFQRVTSVDLEAVGDSVTSIWKRLQVNPSRFASVSVEQLFNTKIIGQFPELADWWTYVSERYAWLVT